MFLMGTMFVLKAMSWAFVFCPAPLSIALLESEVVKLSRSCGAHFRFTCSVIALLVSADRVDEPAEPVDPVVAACENCESLILRPTPKSRLKVPRLKLAVRLSDPKTVFPPALRIVFMLLWLKFRLPRFPSCQFAPKVIWL